MSRAGIQPIVLRAESEFRAQQRREADERFRKFVASGMTRPEIMRRTGLSDTGVANTLRRLNLFVTPTRPGNDRTPSMGTAIARTRINSHLASE